MHVIILLPQASIRELDPLEAPLEAWWSKYQGIAGGAIKITSMLVSASGLPGAAVMDKVVMAAAGATENRESCKRLAFLVRTCDIALSDAGSKDRLLLSGHAEGLLASLKQAMEEVAEVAEEFGQRRGMVMRLVRYSGDADAFKQIHQRLDNCMKVIQCLSCHSRSYMITLHSCLQTFTFYLVVTLWGHVSSQLDTFGQRVALIEERVDRIERLLKKNERIAQEPPQGLKPYLLEWWKQNVGRAKVEVDNDTFFHKLMDTMQSPG